MTGVSSDRGESAKEREMYRLVGLVARSDISVLIRGASGTGKEHIARELHEQSTVGESLLSRWTAEPLPAILPNLNFLGTARGSSPEPTVTGADCSRRLIGVRCSWMRSATFPPRHRYSCCVPYRKDATSPSALPGNTPLMSVRGSRATNENLERAISEGRFREDLFHRLNEFTINVPPLSRNAGGHTSVSGVLYEAFF